MSVAVTGYGGGVNVDEWLALEAEPLRRYEVVGGALVMSIVGGNPHHYIARRLAEQFEAQWPGVIATAPGNWAVQTAPDGRVLVGRVPDVLVNGDDLLRTGVFIGIPVAAVEVWSPGNTLAEMNAKRAEYRKAGLPVLLEAYLSDTGDVHLEWLINAGDTWASVAVASGDNPLIVTGPQSFAIVPNSLMRPADNPQAADLG